MNTRNLLFGLVISATLQGCQILPVMSPDVKVLQEKAIDGDAEAQFLLANAYDTGSGAPRNGEEAIKWYTKSAEQGNAEAQNSLGSIYQAEKRYTEALPWYQKAADQGHPLATNNLAYLYDLGLGVPQNRQKGHDLYMQAANLGWAEAMFNLANMYGAGQLGEVDYHKACIWCFRSRKYAKPESRDVQQRSDQCIEYLKSKLTAAQIEQARIEAENWAPEFTNKVGKK